MVTTHKYSQVDYEDDTTKIIRLSDNIFIRKSEMNFYFRPVMGYTTPPRINYRKLITFKDGHKPVFISSDLDFNTLLKSARECDEYVYINNTRPEKLKYHDEYTVINNKTVQGFITYSLSLSKFLNSGVFENLKTLDLRGNKKGDIHQIKINPTNFPKLERVIISSDELQTLYGLYKLNIDVYIISVGFSKVNELINTLKLMNKNRTLPHNIFLLKNMYGEYDAKNFKESTIGYMNNCGDNVFIGQKKITLERYLKSVTPKKIKFTTPIVLTVFDILLLNDVKCKFLSDVILKWTYNDPFSDKIFKDFIKKNNIENYDRTPNDIIYHKVDYVTSSSLIDENEVKIITGTQTVDLEIFLVIIKNRTIFTGDVILNSENVKKNMRYPSKLREYLVSLRFFLKNYSSLVLGEIYISEDLTRFYLRMIEEYDSKLMRKIKLQKK